MLVKLTKAAHASKHGTCERRAKFCGYRERNVQSQFTHVFGAQGGQAAKCRRDGRKGVSEYRVNVVAASRGLQLDPSCYRHSMGRL